VINIIKNLSGEKDPWLAQARMFACVVRIELEALVQINQLYLATHRVPPLYTSGVRYQSEPANYIKLGNLLVRRAEEFAAIPAVLERGWGDCDDLGPWRCAELRNSGEKAKMRVVWVKDKKTGEKKFHVLVRRANGAVEDPSHKLGMPLSKVGHMINERAT